jgi:hypothetical protein
MLTIDMPSTLATLGSPQFAIDYAAWAVAPGVFLAPWLLLKQQTSPDGVVGALLNPPLWSSAPTRNNFASRMRDNSELWILSYSFAWILFHAASCISTTHKFKFNPKAPPAMFVVSEIARSFGGILVLTIFQIFICAPFLPAQPAELPSMSEMGLWIAMVGLW